MLDRIPSSLLIAVLAIPVAISINNVRKSYAKRPTYSLHPLCPSFISAVYAMYRLGADETNFLLELHATYGETVYIPAPLSQHMILGTSLLKKVYTGAYSKEMAFYPVRKEFSNTVFGLDTWREDHLQDVLFPMHARVLVPKNRVPAPMERYYLELIRCIGLDKTKLETKSEIRCNLIDWAFDLMFSSSVHALFGPKFQDFISMDSMKRHFITLDSAFPILAGGLIPQFIQPYFAPGGISEAIDSRRYLSTIIGKWSKAGCVGLGDDDTVKLIVDLLVDKFSYTPFQVGGAVIGDFWALLANNPYAVTWILTVIIQLDAQLKQELLKEIDDLDLSDSSQVASTLHSFDLPVLNSIINETLRLYASSASMRRAVFTEPFACRSKDCPEGQGTIIYPGESAVCYPRVGHYTDAIWGENPAVYDGRRFLGDDGARLLPEMRAFGGGVSAVCGSRADVLSVITGLIHDFRLLQHSARAETLRWPSSK